MKFHLNIVGCIFVFLGVAHAIFPRYFNWREELTKLSLINRQMMQVHTFFIAVVVVMIGILCLLASDELISTHLGGQIAAGLACFWGLRLVVQLFVYSPRLWKGKIFETCLHIAFTLMWAYATIVFALTALSSP